MKKIFLTSILSILSLAMFSQIHSVDWAYGYRDGGDLLTHSRMIGMTDDNYHVYKQRGLDKSLLTFDLNHEFVDNQNLSIKKDGHYLILNQLVETKAGTYALFNILYQRKKKEWKLYIGSFDQNRVGDLYSVYNYPVEKGFFVKYDFNRYFLDDLILSPDTSKVSFQERIYMKDKSANAKFALVVFNEEMNLLWDKNQEIPYPDKNISLEQTLVNNEGEIFLLTRVYEEAIKHFSLKGNRNSKYSYKVFKVSEDDIQEYDLRLEEGLFPVDIVFLLSQNNEDAFLASGFYSTEEKERMINGLVFLHADKETGVVRSNAYPLDTAFLRNMESRRDLKEREELNLSYKINDVLQFTNGSFAFIAEEYYSTIGIENSAANGGYATTTLYHTDQIIIPRFSQQGELLNIEKINKSFKSSAKGLTSYSLAFAKDKTYMLYNNLKERAERKELREDGIKGGYYTDLTVINQDGEIELQETLFSEKGIDVIYVPFEYVYSNEHLIILGIDSSLFGKQYKCGTIELK